MHFDFAQLRCGTVHGCKDHADNVIDKVQSSASFDIASKIERCIKEYVEDKNRILFLPRTCTEPLANINIKTEKQSNRLLILQESWI